MGWYLPAEREAHAFYAGYCGLRWVLSDADASKGEIDDWNYGAPGMPNANLYASQRTYFNAQLSGATAIGVPLGGNLDFWTSTSSGSIMANVMVIDIAGTSTGIMANSSAFGVRCIRAF